MLGADHPVPGVTNRRLDLLPGRCSLAAVLVRVPPLAEVRLGFVPLPSHMMLGGFKSIAIRGPELFRPAYRYGFESAQHHVGRQWDEAEPDLRQGWDTYQHRGQTASTWEEIKAAVRDAWDRVVGTQHPNAPGRESETRE